jgi:hypothetical protein
MTNKEGGAHVDLEGRPDPYLRLTRGGGSGAKVSQSADGTTEVSFSLNPKTLVADDGDPGINPAPGLIRQIAHELLRTLVAVNPDLVNYEAPKLDAE